MPLITIPERVLVHPKNGMPYFSIRHKKIFTRVGDIGIRLVSAKRWKIHPTDVLASWAEYTANQSEEMRNHLLLPIAALQEIIYKGYDGLFAVRGKRIEGVVRQF